MTQKELLYVTDAIEHENSIMKILGECISKLGDDNLSSFMENEVNNHQNIKDNLMSLLKEKANGE